MSMDEILFKLIDAAKLRYILSTQIKAVYSFRVH
jgi:hypothetical protein